MRAVLWMLSAALLSACSPSVDYDGTEYRCDQSGLCPDGYDCREGLCVRPGERPDADTDDDDDDRFIDARQSEDTMLRSESEPEVPIPDDFFQGIVDAVQFETRCTVTDITVEVDITHEWTGDLLISLQSPSQTEVQLRDSSTEGGGDQIDGTYPTTLEPAESLDAFIGDDSAGPWLLWVADVDENDIGVLHEWAVNLWCEY
ncbi:MAG TPA: proprotein convertase P-domain-containing protein [Kofleriaceae bacterium]|nr:proprotein convertase P-domain-containing protein [Kofleriaceae bacterium]